ncbi:hypothetical protein LIER_25619 [Lithospermum erythrorhizon]|uniref:Uncharacterized protein n=1 Tax=Lithospermum erythrorhizon TaxID=34254 RepID=A0AAV3R9R7_LITER
MKVVKKAASSPRPSIMAELPPRPSQVANPTPHYSPTVASRILLPLSQTWTYPMSLPPILSLERDLQTSDPLMAAGFFTPEFLTPPYTLHGGQQICMDTPFKSYLQSFHAVRPLLLEGLCERYSNAPDPLEVYEDMCRDLIQLYGGFMSRRAFILSGFGSLPLS